MTQTPQRRATDRDPDIRVIHRDDLLVLLRDAAEEGASRALERIGLHDKSAAADIKEARDLIAAFRAAKSTAGRTLVHTITVVIISALLTGTAIKAKLFGN